MKKKNTGTLRLEKTIIGPLNQDQMGAVYGGGGKVLKPKTTEPQKPPPPPSGNDCTSYIPQR